MSGKAPPATAEMHFCSQCGTRLPVGARFCSGCGRALHETPRPQAPSARTLRDQIPGLTVLALFLAVGLGIWVTVLRPGAPSSSAPRRSGPGPVAEGASVPPDHPPLSLPAEAQQFIAQLTAKAEAAPADVNAWKNLAQVQARAAEIDPSYGAKAVESYRHLLNLAPDDGEAIRGLGNVYYDQQQYGAAAEQYESYLKRTPDDPNVRTDLATTYLYQHQIDRALEIYNQVIKARPEFLQAHFNLGLAYEAKGERDKALASLATARALATDDATRSRIDRVVTQLTGEGGSAPGSEGVASATGTGAAVGRGGADGGPPPHPGGAAASGAPAAGDFRGEVEAALHAHQILGPKITRIDWPDMTRARVLVSSFPMQSMPEFARNLFRARLETILDDAKTKHGVTEPRSIELVDAASGESMETVTH